jgi:hypothetical protein
MIITDYRIHLQRVLSDQVLHGLRRGGHIYKIAKSASTCDYVFELIAVPF